MTAASIPANPSRTPVAAALPEQTPEPPSAQPSAQPAEQRAERVLPTPLELAQRLPLAGAAAATVARGREALRAILDGRDPRRVAIVGPCSLHEAEGTFEFARRLRTLADELGDELLIVMRTYVEKPRSTVGWKGLVNDPHLDGSCDIAHGLGLAREWMLRISAMGLPCASELLDPLAAPYFADLLTWGGIGARTAESQPHRELASGFPAPVGFKNGTQGDLQGALDAVVAARAPQSAIGLDARGRATVRRLPGNPYAHVVLRGGKHGSNHDAATVERAARALRRDRGGMRPVLVDCSHGNSGKDPALQSVVLQAVLRQLRAGDRSIAGVLLESHLRPGRQVWRAGEARPTGISITDACIGWDETEQLLRNAAASAAQAAHR
jgi:3-deoxy-7-phosphoheptulonate synthase